MWVFVFFWITKTKTYSNLSGGAEAMMASGGVIRGQKGHGGRLNHLVEKPPISSNKV